MPDGSDLAAARATRQVLLLQGLMGPFFNRLGEALRRDGYGVHKVNFNGGDRLFWRGEAIDYTGTEAEWPSRLERIIRERAITDIMLFGDCRTLHRAAVVVCRRLRIPVHVFEEGYIRPDFVTLELGGVNGHSSLPDDPAFYLAEATRLPPAPPNSPVPSSFRRRATEGVLYNAADILTRWRYQHWSNHRPWHPVHEGIGWLRRLARGRSAAARSRLVLDRLERGGSSYFLFPLQLDADAQIRHHSRFGDMGEAINVVVASFARHAPPELRLVVKEHPLDNGLTDWRRIVEELARTHGVSGRVDYLESGDIALLVRPARGLVTINSTTGTLAAASGVPVATLGGAVYAIRGIVHDRGLDTFWTAPTPPDPAVFAAFRRVLIDRCLLRGGFFSEEALDVVVGDALRRFEAARAPLADPIVHGARRAEQVA